MNFKHLHYFWVTAKAGGIMRAGEQLHTTPQTLSGQIKLLEDWLGRKLFRKSGRKLELTEDGHLALGYADQIFTLGAELETAVRQAHGGQRVLDFKVGVADSVPNPSPTGCWSRRCAWPSRCGWCAARANSLICWRNWRSTAWTW
jgi:LysR family transcriptional activator of nhaA